MSFRGYWTGFFRFVGLDSLDLLTEKTLLL